MRTSAGARRPDGVGVPTDRLPNVVCAMRTRRRAVYRVRMTHDIGAGQGFADSDGLRIAYEVSGAASDRRPILLMHGYGANVRANWVDPGWVRRLGEERLVIGFDVRGHGRSDKPHDAARYGYAAMANDALAVLEHLDVACADFAGHSLGAFSGVHLLAHHGNRFGAFIWMGIGDESPASVAEAPEIADALRAPDAENVTTPLGRMYRNYIDLESDNDREALALAALQMWPEGFPLVLGGDLLSVSPNPVLILNGSEDRPYVETDARLAEEIPNATLLRIQGADHLGPVTDGRFIEEAIRFLDQESPGGDGYGRLLR